MDIIGVIDKIKGAITGTRPVFPVLPAMLMACSLARRPGLSVSVSVANVVSSLKKDGFPMGKMPDGQPDYTGKLVHSIISEVFRAQTQDARTDTVHAPFSITLTGTAVGAAGPMAVTVTNQSYVQGKGQTV